MSSFSALVWKFRHADRPSWTRSPMWRILASAKLSQTTGWGSNGNWTRVGALPRSNLFGTWRSILRPRCSTTLRSCLRAWKLTEVWMTRSDCSDPCTTWPGWTSQLRELVFPLLTVMSSSNAFESKIKQVCKLFKCFISGLFRLIQLDQEWVPHCTSSSLYIRPTMIGVEPTLGVSASNEVDLFVLLGPVGPYFATGAKPVRNIKSMPLRLMSHSTCICYRSIFWPIQSSSELGRVVVDSPKWAAIMLQPSGSG